VVVLKRKGLASLSLLSVALFAIDRAPLSGFKRHSGFGTALSAGYSEHLPRLPIVAPALFPLCRPAFRTARGLVLQAVRLVELLLTGAENEFLPAVTADESLVFQSHLLLLLIFCQSLVSVAVSWL
jgi:hypothetical protein